MRPITLPDVVAQPDILDQTRFAFYLGVIPGNGDTNSLMVKCVNATLPEVGNESFDAPMAGFTPNFRGRKTPPTPLSFTFYEDSEMRTLTALRRWHQNVVGDLSGNSQGYISQYAVNASLSIFDTTGREAASHIIKRMYPVTINEITLSGESSAPVQVTVMYRYLTFTSSTHTQL